MTKYTGKYLVCILSLLSLLACINPNNKSITLQNGIVDVNEFDSKKADFVKLSGEIIYYPNVFVNDSNIISVTEKPILIQFPGYISNQLAKPEYIHYGTYVIKFKNVNYSINWGIYIKYIYSAYKIYCNSILIDSCGTIGMTKETQNPMAVPKVIQLPFSENENVVYIQVSNFHDSQTHIISDIEFGNLEFLLQKKYSISLLDLILLSLTLVISISLLYFRFSFKGNGFYYYSFFSIILTIRIGVMDSKIFLDMLNGFWEVCYRLEYITFYTIIGLIPKIVEKIISPQKKYRIINSFVFYFSLLYSFTTIFISFHSFYFLLFIYQIFALVVSTYSIVLIAIEKKQNNKYALGLIYIFVLLVLLGSIDILLSIVYYYDPIFNNWIFLIFILASSSFLIHKVYSESKTKIT